MWLSFDPLKHSMRRRISELFVVAFVSLLANGCMTSSRLADRTHLSRHPTQETRMTAKPTEGYVTTGVWKIRGVHNSVYLAATAHIVAEDEIPFPSSFYAAYRDSKEVYVEFDTLDWWSQMSMLRVVPRLVKWVKLHQAELVCPKGRNLASYLSKETMDQLRVFYGKDFRKMERMTPLGLMFWGEFSGPGGMGENGGVDDLFTLLAHRDHKKIRALDDGGVLDMTIPVMDEAFVEAQQEIASKGPDKAIKESILTEGGIEDEMDWRSGDLSVIERAQAEMKGESPVMYEKLLPERNRKWLPKLERALHQKHNVMILVGAMHVAGKDGLLTMLQQAGYSAEQVYGVELRPVKMSER
jgi:uncharacterized protein